MTYIVSFVSGFCILVVEMVAGRMLAPYFGVSLYTWTSIIGVVLAGIGAGAYAGGMLADRFPSRSSLGVLLFLAGIAVFLIPPILNIVVMQELNIALMWKVLLALSAIFFVPSMALGMILPLVVKQAVYRLDETGGLVGRIYALSTAGSLAGVFLSGLFLISFMGTRTIIFFVGAFLILTAVIAGGYFRTRPMVVHGAAFGAVSVTWSLFNCGPP